ncbi:MAG: hypothetical protein IPN25_07465 [Sphingobacteriales bacterium]|nr:hypothetical protein [Sphingobacteriales bacterium]
MRQVLAAASGKLLHCAKGIAQQSLKNPLFFAVFKKASGAVCSMAW